MLALGAQWLSPLILHPERICTFTPNSSPLCSFSTHTFFSTCAIKDKSFHLWTCALDLPHLRAPSFLRPTVYKRFLLTEPETSPSISDSPKDLEKFFSCASEGQDADLCMSEEVLAAPSRGCSAHRALPQWPESGFPCCLPGHCTDILGADQG